MFEINHYYECQDVECGKYRIVELATRLNFYKHTANKSDERMITVIEKFNLIPRIVVRSFDRFTLRNLFTDFSEQRNLSILLSHGVKSQ